MATRQVVLDTETTGIDPKQGHRIIEIGCVEMIDRKLTGNHYHQYINPNRIVEDEAISVHGITNEFLIDKPKFNDIVEDFMQFIEGAELVIHNAPFDVGFIDHELKRVSSPWKSVNQHCTVLDTLTLARKMHPGQKNSLDALCKRYGIDNSHRTLHGALLDSEILADVYLLMTGGQTALGLNTDEDDEQAKLEIRRIKREPDTPFVVLKATEDELALHQERLKYIEEQSGTESVWLSRAKQTGDTGAE